MMRGDPAYALAEVLEAENAALRALDFPRVTALLEEKRRALAMLGRMGAPATPVLGRLQQTAKENRELLERAVLIQGRIIGIVLQAAVPKPRGYAAGGYAARGLTGALCVRSTV
ncbi:MAG: hypothetical protein JO122_16215 [Acetobacteraceae bacterium]|nr:hypothetical protein [Acetobacteraceae bacterium]